MNRLWAAFLSGSLLLLGGCASWPPSGFGGFAEHHLQTLIPETPISTVVPEDGLRFEQELLARHLDVLVLEGAELCFPATVVQAQRRQNRIAREINGGLEQDAANDIIIQRKLLMRLERQLDHVLQYDICILPVAQSQETPGEMGSRIHDLLNADNQFAFGSAELNPKYVGRLAEAAKLLLDYPHYRLRITGHADAIGKDGANQALSQHRADQVARYLQIFGLSADRLILDAVGAADPLFEGTQAEVRLTNRRVSIELVEGPLPTTPEGGPE